MTVGLLANVSITASLCYAIDLIAGYGTDNWDNLSRFAVPFLTAASGLAVRYISTRAAGNTKDILSRKVKKDLRKKVYNKLIRFGIRSSDDMKMAGMTQISVEGIEQLDLFYSTYMPQLVYAMCAPVILFFITVWVDWRAALVLLICVPLIPLSIAAVSRYAKKFLQSIGESIFLWGIVSSTVYRGLKN